MVHFFLINFNSKNIFVFFLKFSCDERKITMIDWKMIELDLSAWLMMYIENVDNLNKILLLRFAKSCKKRVKHLISS